MRTRHRRKHHAGFTFIELLLVFSTLSILSLTGIASFNAFSNAQTLSNASLDVKNMISTAKYNSLSQVIGSSCTNQPFNGYKVLICCKSGGSGCPSCNLTNDYEMDIMCGSTPIAVSGKNLPKGVTFDNTNTTSRSYYFPSLTNSVTGAGTVVIDGFNSSRQVTVSSTGVIQMGFISIPPTPTPTPPAPTNTPIPTATPTPIPSCSGIAGNLVQNCSFETISGFPSPWQYHFQAGGAGSITQDSAVHTDGAYSANLVITNPGSYDYSDQLEQSSIPVTSGHTYKVQFDALASPSRTISVANQQGVSPWTVYGSSAFTLGTSFATFSYTFTSPMTDSNSLLNFNVGLSTNGVHIDNVSMVDTGAPTPTPTPTPGPVVLSNLTVSDTANAANWSIQANNLATGINEYGDRSSTWSTIPSQFLGKSWVKTANSSKGYSPSPLVSFTINQTATVYVGSDTRITALPAWLSDGTWSNTGLQLSDSTGIFFNIYSKSFTAGTVTLGSEPSSYSLYTVIVQ